MSRDSVVENIKVKIGFKPQTITSTVTGTAVDTSGYHSLACVAHYATNGDTLDGSNYITFKLQHSTASGSGFVDIPDALIVDAASIGSETNAFGVDNDVADDDAVYVIGARDYLRYVRVIATVTGSLTYGTTTSSVFLLGWASKADVGNTRQGS